MVRRLAWLLLLAACAPTGKQGEGKEPEPDVGVPPPKLIQPATPSPTQEITLRGYATPGHRVEIFVDSVLQGDTVTRADGVFEFRGLLLRPGRNLITATAIDAEGRRSANRPSGGGDRPDIGGTLRPEVRVDFEP